MFQASQASDGFSVTSGADGGNTNTPLQPPLPLTSRTSQPNQGDMAVQGAASPSFESLNSPSQTSDASKIQAKPLSDLTDVDSALVRTIAYIKIIKNITIVKNFIENASKSGIDNALATAVYVENPEIVNILVNKGVSKEYIDQALAAAVYVGNPEIVNILVKKGISKEYIDKAFAQAVRLGRPEIVRIILQEGVSKECIGQALGQAARQGSVEIINILLNALKEGPSGYSGQAVEYIGKALVEIVKEYIKPENTLPQQLAESSNKTQNDTTEADLRNYSNELKKKQENFNNLLEIIKIAKSQSSQFDPYIGEALMLVAKTKGSESGKIAELLFAAGVNVDSFGNAWEIANDEQNPNTDFINAFAFLKMDQQQDDVQ